MAITLIRVINEQTISSPSILLDKLDDGQANTEGYAQRAKLQVYVPYSNPVDPTVKGYVDLIPTDRVLLSANNGTIAGLAASSPARISVAAVNSALLATPTITAAANAAGNTTIDGTTFLSVTPDVTYVTFENLVGATETVSQSVFTTHTAVQIVVPDAALSIGVPAVGWLVTVQSNSRQSAQFTM